jgi:hypothetical protein
LELANVQWNCPLSNYTKIHPAFHEFLRREGQTDRHAGRQGGAEMLQERVILTRFIGKLQQIYESVSLNAA